MAWNKASTSSPFNDLGFHRCVGTMRNVCPHGLGTFLDLSFLVLEKTVEHVCGDIVSFESHAENFAVKQKYVSKAPLVDSEILSYSKWPLNINSGVQGHFH